jgi:lipopolysaccharide export system protein LptA
LGASPSDPGSIVLAEVMDYDTNSGFIRYSQNVYLLSEDQQLQADALEAAPGGSRIKAFGNVLHRILRTQGTNPGIEVSGKTQPSDSNTEGKSAEKPISIKSAKLEYVKEANKVTYSGDVSLSTTDLLIQSRLLEAILDDNGKSIERATARDDVMIFKENWECKKGEIAYYYSNPEKFIVTGSPLEFFDPEGRRSLPHRLTYIVADGRIQLEKRGN